jgi:cell division transport system ATP-binding protein
MHVFQQFRNVGVSLLIASHDTTLISRLNYRTLTLHKGRLLSDQAAGGLE